MKRLFPPHLRLQIMILLSCLAAVLLIYCGLWRDVAAETYSPVSREQQLSPVWPSERALFYAIVQQRRKQQLRSFTPDWNLFRTARLEAGRIATGAAQKPNEVAGMLEPLGYVRSSIRIVVLRADSRRDTGPSLWRQSMPPERLKRLRGSLRIGTGYASGSRGRVWVVLFADRGGRSSDR